MKIPDSEISSKPKPKRPDRRKRHPTVSLRVTPAQLAEIVRRAETAGLTRNAFVIKSALAGSGLAPRRRHTVDPAALDTIQGLLGGIGRLGNNINQLARAANTGAPVAVAPDYWDRVLEYLKSMDTQLVAALGRKTE